MSKERAKDLELTHTGPALSERRLNSIEQKYGIQLPSDYRKFLLKNNGGKPNRPLFGLEGRKKNTECIHYFLSIADDPVRSFEEYYRRYKLVNRRMPKEFIPIAFDPGGNLICLCTAGRETGSVYFWSHEEEADFQFERQEPTRRNLRRVAGSFQAFVDRLDKS